MEIGSDSVTIAPSRVRGLKTSPKAVRRYPPVALMCPPTGMSPGALRVYEEDILDERGVVG